MAVGDERLHVHRREPVLLLVAPHGLGARGVTAELEEQVLVLEPTDEEMLADLHRGHDDRAVVGAVGRLPEDRAGFRHHGVDPIGLHEDELTHAGVLDDRRRRVALLGGRSDPPELLARPLVERGGVRDGGADDADEPVAIDERMTRVAPERGLRRVVLLQVASPDDASVGDVETEQIPFGTERVDAVTVHDGRAARAGRVGDRVGHRILVLPEHLPGLLVEAEHPLGAGGRLAVEVRHLDVIRRDVVGDEHAPPGYGGSGVPAGDRRAPEQLRATGGKPVEKPVLAPLVVPSRPHPLRPVVGPRGSGREQGQDQQASQAVAHVGHDREAWRRERDHRRGSGGHAAGVAHVMTRTWHRGPHDTGATREQSGPPAQAGGYQRPSRPTLAPLRKTLPVPRMPVPAPGPVAAEKSH